jgi:hypothetical protein
MTKPIEDGPLPGCPLSSTHGRHGSCEDVGDRPTPFAEARPLDQTVEVEANASTYGQAITLTTHTLGLDPYVLVRAVKLAPDDEDDDGLRLKIEFGGGAEGPELAALYLLNLPAAQNPLTAAIKSVIDANPDAHEVPEVLALFAEFCDIPMPESGS